MTCPDGGRVDLGGAVVGVGEAVAADVDATVLAAIAVAVAFPSAVVGRVEGLPFAEETRTPMALAEPITMTPITVMAILLLNIVSLLI